ncbi:MAG TPA: hypothetical protein DDY78_04495 [Planctomycetales bacterium]|jgi:hypothetical protein|nr:hypothetical protein [Planctomycetales bacterium]
MKLFTVRRWETARRPFFCSFVLLFVVMGGADLQAQDANALARRFLDEAPPCWELLKDQQFQLRGKIRAAWTWGKTSGHAETDIKEKSGNQLRSPQPLPDGQENDNTAYVVNADYIFSLKRKAQNALWVLSDFQKKGKDFRLPTRFQEEGGIGYGVQTVLLNCGAFLPDLVRQPSFRVVRAAVENREGAEFIRVDYDNTHPVNQKPIQSVQSGTMLLDPARCWCVREFEVHTGALNDESVTRSDVIEIRDSSVAHFPLPVHIASTTKHRQFSPDGKAKEEVFTSTGDMRYDLEEPYPLADAEFRLPAFGLPEPAEPPQPLWQRWYVWAITAGLACLAAAAVCSQFLRRKKPKSDS